MNNHIQYSIIEHLRESVPELADVVWMYDGLEISKIPKPFAIVEALQEGGENLASGRSVYRDEFLFQIGIFADSQFNVNQYASMVKNHLRKAIVFYDTNQQPPSSGGFFHADVGNIVPMRQEDATTDTLKHRSYIDVSVKLLINSDGTFTQ